MTLFSLIAGMARGFIPLNVTASVSGSDIVISHDEAYKADSYNYYASIDGGAWTLLGNSATIPYTFTPTTPGEYNFRVTSVRGTQESAPSAETLYDDMMEQVYSDTISGLRVSAVDGTAFVDSDFGAEKVTDPSFSNWTLGSLDDWTTTRGTASESGDYAEFTRGVDGGDGNLGQILSLTAGKKYRIAGTVKNGTATNVRLWLDNTISGDVLSNAVSATSDTDVVFYFTCPAGGSNFIKFLVSGGSGTTGYIKNISVREISSLVDYADGNHLLEIEDSLGNVASGVLKAQGSGETLGAIVDSGTLTADALYQIVSTEADHFGTGLVVGDYFTSDGTETCDASNTVKQVTAPSTSGSVIVNEIDGTTENFFAVEAGFTRNQTSHICRVKKIVPTA